MRDHRGPKNPNWRGGSDGKGRCSRCGGETWRLNVTLCKRCYVEELRQRIGPANPEWENFTSTDPQQGRDRATRRKSLGPCERCGRPAYDRHHLDDDQMNNDPANLQALCRRCHMIMDGRLERLRERMRTLPRRS